LTEARTQAPRAALGERVGAALIALCCLMPLILAAGLSPDPRGAGTHTQLGLPVCGWTTAFDAPCPTCGMTTAFALAVHLRPLEAFRAQPMGFLIAVGAAAGFWIALYVAATGSLLGRTCGRLLTPRALWIAAALTAAAWAYKWLTWPV
jgi:hypothetical protein